MSRRIINPRDLNGTDAASIAKVLGGTRTGQGYLLHCPVIGHGRGRGDINPSLSVADGDRRLLIYCHAKCDPRDVLYALRTRGLLDGAAIPREPRPRIAAQPESDQRVEALWAATMAAEGSPVEMYLRHQRGILMRIPACVRFGRDLTMVVAVHDLGGKLVAVQQTFLTADGHKAPVDSPRITHGKLGDGAARLAEPTDTLGLAEGVEDALSANQLTGVPTWASLGAGRMRKIAVPAGIRDLCIFADQDVPGERAAYETAQFHVSEGRSVAVRFPPEGHKDWNSILEINPKKRSAA
jgi:hypothetical protein